MNTITVTDRIEKTVRLRAPRTKVWQAITTAEKFGSWFGVRLDGQFAAGTTVHGRITMPGYDHLTVEMRVERIEPERLFAYRWHPYAVDPQIDYSAEPMTLVEFTLDDQDGETVLTIVESGFDRIPLSRRAEAYRMNDGGWAAQAGRIERYVTEA
jgi:uncharacterized protein YndB with AHSA1/START domain